MSDAETTVLNQFVAAMHKSTNLATTAATKCATITILGNFAIVQPDHADLLAPQLQYSAIEFCLSKKGTISHHRSVFDFFERQDGDRLLIPAGAVPRLAVHLCRAGLDVTIQDHRPLDKPAFDVDDSALAEGNRKAPGFTDAIRTNFSGLIETPEGKVRGHFIGLICRLLPKARVIVPAATVRETSEIGAALGHYVGGEVDVVRKSAWQSACRVVCCTFTSFDKSNPADWDIVVFPDAVQATAKIVHQIRGEYTQHRVYGFVAPRAALSVRIRLQLELLAGPVLWSSAPARADQHIEIVFAAAPLGVAPGAGDQAHRRRSLWRDQRRNQLLADVALGFAARRPDLLWEHGLFVDDPLPFGRWSSGPRVLVAVESAEHGEQLARLLPDWPLLHAKPSALNSAAAPRWDDFLVPDKAIITTVRAGTYKKINTDVLIVASGGSYPTSAIQAHRHGMLLVVDIADDYDGMARAGTRSRLRHYQAQGYTVTAAPRWLLGGG